MKEQNEIFSLLHRAIRRFGFADKVRHCQIMVSTGRQLQRNFSKKAMSLESAPAWIKNDHGKFRMLTLPEINDLRNSSRYGMVVKHSRTAVLSRWYPIISVVPIFQAISALMLYTLTASPWNAF